MKAAKEKKKFWNIPVVILMAGMFFVLLFLVCQYQGEEKEPVIFFSIGCMMTMAGTMVLSICYGGSSLKKNRHRRISYQLLLFFTFLGTFFAGFSFIFYNTPGRIAEALLFYSLEACATSALVFLLIFHDQTYFDIKKSTGRLLLGVMFIIMLGIIFMVLINNIIPVFFVVREDLTYNYTPLGIGIWTTFMLSLAFYTVLSFFFVKDKRTRFFLALNKTGPVLWVVFEVLFSSGMEITFAFLSNFSTFLTLLLMFCFVYIEDSRKMAAQERELAHLRLNSLRAQINPHFIYNTLGTIADMCNTDPKEAEEMIYDFSDYLRDNFSDVERQSVHSFSEELEHVKHYLSIEQKRFPNIEINYDIKALEFMIPAMTLQPVIENSIKHGICARRKSKGTIVISSEERENDFLVKIEDDGVGFDTKAKPAYEEDENVRHHGIGLQNTKKRLEMISSGSLLIESIPGKGTKCYIILPKEVEKKGKQ